MRGVADGSAVTCGYKPRGLLLYSDYFRVADGRLINTRYFPSTVYIAALLSDHYVAINTLLLCDRRELFFCSRITVRNFSPRELLCPAGVNDDCN